MRENKTGDRPFGKLHSPFLYTYMYVYFSGHRFLLWIWLYTLPVYGTLSAPVCVCVIFFFSCCFLTFFVVVVVVFDSFDEIRLFIWQSIKIILYTRKNPIHESTSGRGGLRSAVYLRLRKTVANSNEFLYIYVVRRCSLNIMGKTSVVGDGLMGDDK